MYTLFRLKTIGLLLYGDESVDDQDCDSWVILNCSANEGVQTENKCMLGVTGEGLVWNIKGGTPQ